MNAAGRLGLYAGGVAVAFGAAFATAAAVVPDSAVAGWKSRSAASAGHGGMDMTPGNASASSLDGVRGLSLATDGLTLSPVTAPQASEVAGTLSFRVVDATGTAVTGFAPSHEKKLHLIVVRADGSQFRHVHPDMDASGTWSIPWQWAQAGTYRVFADFVPAGTRNAPAITLTRTVQVAGAFTPVTQPDSRASDDVDGYHVTITGELAAGATGDLAITVTKDGRPVTTLEPYLGSFGHLVALREGDLGYLHVHAETADPAPQDRAGPTIRFAAAVPTGGRYLLYLDFQVDKQVHTAEFVLVAATGATTVTPNPGPSPSAGSNSHGHSGH
ncbi:hypothetical protein AB0M46_09755 [Dactylosporangium sp. NPDC051485]|uniref:hypothetical protein n=1 Tax=Dactylosporangium sp. NPDC051485 TaxID=3154846 RepID=UPI00341558CC